MNGKRVVVAGGSSGIGFGIARAVRAAGADVVIVGRHRGRLDVALAALRGAGERSDQDERGASIDAFAADIGSEADVARLFESIGACDHIVSTAADLVYRPVLELDVAAARRALDSKLIGPLLLARHGAPRLRPGGSLTFTSGVAADRPRARGALTATVNSGLEGLARALALELAPVRVNVVSPGWVDTPMWEAVAGSNRAAVQGEMAARLPVGRLGTAEDLAPAYLMLMANGFATGTVLHVDGGHRLV